MKFGTRLCLKPSNDRGEFEFDQAKSKNITENSVALGYETHNSTIAGKQVPLYLHGPLILSSGGNVG